MVPPNVLVLRAPGANCDNEAKYAFELAGAKAETLHINALRKDPKVLRKYQILCLPGGFSYGDDAGAGKILAVQLQHFLSDAVREFRDRNNLILGICNGFQTLLKAGLLIPPDEDGPLATLTNNVSGVFGDRWVKLTAMPGNCVFLKGVEQMEVPVAHGEGNFVVRKEWILQGLEQAGQVVLKYHGLNPNGSMGDVAGLSDATGRVLGLMPHPERHILGLQHPRWTREGLKPHGDGLRIFQNAVEHFRD